MMAKHYDYLIVGSGLFGATFAHFAHKQGKKCLVIDKRSHLGGNIYCENIEGINVHKYGAHIFHTDNKYVWDYVNSLVPFNHFINSPLARFRDRLFNLPFNMTEVNHHAILVKRFCTTIYGDNAVMSVQVLAFTLICQV